MLGKNPDSEARQTWALLLALPLAGCVILGKSLNLSGLHVLHRQNGTDDRHTDHTGGVRVKTSHRTYWQNAT